MGHHNFIKIELNKKFKLIEGTCKALAKFASKSQQGLYCLTRSCIISKVAFLQRTTIPSIIKPYIIEFDNLVMDLFLVSANIHKNELSEVQLDQIRLNTFNGGFNIGFTKFLSEPSFSASVLSSLFLLKNTFIVIEELLTSTFNKESYSYFINEIISSFKVVISFNSNYNKDFIKIISSDDSYIYKKHYMKLQNKFCKNIKLHHTNLFWVRTDFQLFDKIRLNSLRSNIEAKWVRESIPRKTEFFNNLTWEIYCRRMLGLDIPHIPTHINCICGQPNDKTGHHLGSNCSHGNERIHTHDAVTHTINNMVKSANLNAHREFQHSTEHNNRSDITIFNLPGGSYKQTVMIDFAQVNPFASSYISRNPMVGDAINIKEKQKISKYSNANLINEDSELIPIIMDSMGLMNTKGRLFIKHISSIIGNIHGVPDSIIYKYWMKRIQVVFQQSIANAIVSRSYTIRKRYNGLDYTCQLPYIMQDSYRIYSSYFNCSDRLD